MKYANEKLKSKPCQFFCLSLSWFSLAELNLQRKVLLVLMVSALTLVGTGEATVGGSGVATVDEKEEEEEEGGGGREDAELTLDKYILTETHQ